MRVVAGDAGGRRLVTPTGRTTRPTTDRVREAVFNRLFSLGGVEACAVLDCYAGSGALGIEALSRGADTAVFVDNGRAAIAAIDANLDTLGYADRARVHRAGVIDWLAGGGGPFDVVFADPPYELDEWDRFFVALARASADDAVVVCEADRVVEPGAGWEKLSDRTYGGTVITIIRRRVTDSEE